MSNLFEDVMEDAGKVKEKLIGPAYPYYKNIKMPSDIGMSSKGSLSALGKNVDGLISYVEILVSGKSNASKTGGPLGNKFFLKTGGKCNHAKTNTEQDRYIYINNVPQGNIPFLSSGMGVNFTDFRGLIPGTMGNMDVLNPFKIMQSFLAGSTPDCREVTLETIDINNNKSNETHYVTVVDLQNISPCTFPDKTNPITKLKCKEAFEELHSENILPDDLPVDILTQLYFLALSGVSIYIIYNLMKKINKK
jgi:hypothetical protein